MNKAVEGGVHKNIKTTDKLDFKIHYTWQGKMYKEKTQLNLKTFYLLNSTRQRDDDYLKTIAYTLQDLVEKQL